MLKVSNARIDFGRKECPKITILFSSLNRNCDENLESAYKAFYERLFQKWNIPVKTEVEVSRQAKKIDVVVRYEEEYLIKLKNTAFWFFRRVNSLALKSPEDSLDLADYMRIVSRAYGFLVKQKKELDRLPENATITIVCSVRPDKVLVVGLILGKTN